MSATRNREKKKMVEKNFRAAKRGLERLLNGGNNIASIKQEIQKLLDNEFKASNIIRLTSVVNSLNFLCMIRSVKMF